MYMFTLQPSQAPEKQVGWTGNRGIPQPDSLHVVIPNNRLYRHTGTDTDKTNSVCLCALQSACLVFFPDSLSSVSEMAAFPQTTDQWLCHNNNRYPLTQFPMKTMTYDLKKTITGVFLDLDS